MIGSFKRSLIYLVIATLAVPITLFSYSVKTANAFDSSYKSAESYSELDIGGTTWSSRESAEVSDDTYAVAEITSSSNPTNYLMAEDYSFSIPSWAVIDGIEVSVERHRSINAGASSSVTDDTVKMLKDGIAVGDNMASATLWPNSDAVEVYGGPSNLWGATWTASDINSTGFGMAISAKRNNTGDRTVYIDSIAIKVYYSDKTAPIIEPHDDVTVEATSALGAIVNYTEPVANDNYDAPSSALCAPASGSQFALGETVITCNKTDSSGNPADPVNFKILVADTIKPQIISKSSTPDTTGDETTLSVEVYDEVEIAFVGISVNGSSFNLMTPTTPGSKYAYYYVLPLDSLNPVTYQIKVVDTSGNETISTPLSVITPIDNDKPIIKLNGDSDITVEQGSNYQELGASWQDNIDGSGQAIVSGDVVDANTLGLYIIKYNYTDSSGNQAVEVTRSVNVVKTFQAGISNLSIAPKDGKVILSWSPANGALIYNIYYKKSSDSAFPIKYISTSNTSTEIINLENGQSYDFAVVAEGTGGVLSQMVTISAVPNKAVAEESAVVRAVAVETAEVLPQEPVDTSNQVSEKADQQDTETDDSQGKIKGDEENIDTSEDEESVNWTPWIILFILIILAGAATGGYFYWFAGEEEVIRKKEPAPKVEVKEQKKNSNKNPPASNSKKSGKKQRRW